jgi:hypothetical protein
MVEGRRNIDRGQRGMPSFVKEMLHVEVKSRNSHAPAEVGARKILNHDKQQVTSNAEAS